MTPEQALQMLRRAVASMSMPLEHHMEFIAAANLIQGALAELAALKAAKPTEPDAATSGS